MSSSGESRFSALIRSQRPKPQRIEDNSWRAKWADVTQQSLVEKVSGGWVRSTLSRAGRLACTALAICLPNAVSAQEAMTEDGRSVYALFGDAFTIYKGHFYCEFYLDFQGGTTIRLNAHADRKDFFFNVENPSWNYLAPNVGRSASVVFSFARGSTERGYSGIGRVYQREGFFGFGGSDLGRELLGNLVYEPSLWIRPSVDGVALPPIALEPVGAADAVTSYEQCIRDVEAEEAEAAADLDEIIQDLSNEEN